MQRAFTQRLLLALDSLRREDTLMLEIIKFRDVEAKSLQTRKGNGVQVSVD